MRVGYLASSYPAVSHTFISREVAGLRARGVEVVTFAIRPAPAEQLLTDSDRAEARATTTILPASPGHLIATVGRALVSAPGRFVGALISTLRLNPGGVRGLLWRLFYFVEALLLHEQLRAHDIHHLHVHFANAGGDIAQLAVEFGDRPGHPMSWSFTMHGPTEFYDVERHHLREKVQSASFVACISDFCRSQLMRTVDSPHWDKLNVVHCGIDTAHFDTAARNTADGRLEVLFIGRLVGDKGPQVLLDAVAEARAKGHDVWATYVGDGAERSRLERSAAELGLAEVVEFAGAVGQDRIRDYIERADVFCLPSFAEGVPIVLMEAMAMRRPVVTSAIMGIPELVENERTGLTVPPGRPDLLAEAFRRLADDRALRERLAEEGRRRVVEEFSIGASAERLDALFAQFASEQRERASASGQQLPTL